MFADKIGESCPTTGTGTFTLGGTYGSFRTWRSGFATGTSVFYLATNDTGTIWEIGYGTLTTGGSDTLSRTLIASSSGALISWVTTPYRIFSVPAGVAMAHLVAGGKATSRPAWLQRGGEWLDDSNASAWSTGYAIEKRYTGSVDVERGRVESASIYTPSPRNRWVDNGAANLTMTVNHIGQVIEFNTIAAARTFTLLAGATTGIGHGFTCWVIGYGGNVVTLAPNGSERIDVAVGGTSVSIPPNRLTRLSWDGGRSQWRTDAQIPLVYNHISGLTLSTAGSSATFAITAGRAADKTNAAMVSLAASLSKTTSAWSVGSGNGGLDTGAIANSTWYHVHLIQRTDTGVVDALISLSATAPTMPTNYTLSRRIGSIQTNGSAQWVKFNQQGDRFDRLAVLDFTAGGTSTATLRTLSVPLGVIVVPIVSITVQAVNNTTSIVQLAPATDATLLVTAATAYEGAAAEGSSNTSYGPAPPTNTSSQIYVAVPNFSSAATLSSSGWIDRRGQDD